MADEVTEKLDNLSVEEDAAAAVTTAETPLVSVEEKPVVEKPAVKSNPWEEEERKNEEIREKLIKREESLTLEERRKRYYCGSRYVTASEIVSWQDYEPEDEPDAKPPKYEVNEEINRKIAIWRGNITTLEIDGIVNAANNSLLGGGGVDGAIHDAAGSSLRRECATLGGCSTGNAKVTRGYKLPAKYVIHTVGPVGEKPQQLESCYTRCLELAAKNNIRTLAFCGISTGIYGYPLSAATHIALDTTRSWLQKDDNKDKVDLIIFCVFLSKELATYERLAAIYFPKPPTSESPPPTSTETPESEPPAPTEAPEALTSEPPTSTETPEAPVEGEETPTEVKPENN